VSAAWRSIKRRSRLVVGDVVNCVVAADSPGAAQQASGCWAGAPLDPQCPGCAAACAQPGDALRLCGSHMVAGCAVTITWRAGGPCRRPAEPCPRGGNVLLIIDGTRRLQNQPGVAMHFPGCQRSSYPR
jgi:hypothetical protein